MMSPGAQGNGNEGEDTSHPSSLVTEKIVTGGLRFLVLIERVLLRWPLCAQRSPHGLHNVLKPSGPLRRCEVVVTPQLKHEKSSATLLVVTLSFTDDAAGSTRQNFNLPAIRQPARGVKTLYRAERRNSKKKLSKGRGGATGASNCDA